MPEIPMYTRKIEKQDMPGPRFSASATGESFGATEARRIGEIGEAIGRLGQVKAVIDKEEETKRDRSLVRDELNAARSEIREYMDNVYRSQGKDAINSYVEVDKTLNEIRKRRLQNFTTLDQKDLFASNYDTFAEAHKNRAITFQTEARQNYEKTTIDAENQIALEDAISAYRDPEEVKRSEETIIANTKYLMKSFGPEVMKQAVMENVDNLYTNLVASIGQNDPENALIFYEKNKDKFDPRKKEALEKTLKEKAKEAQAKKIAIDISTSGLSFPEQLTQVDKITDPEIAKKVNTLVTDRQNLKTSIEEAKVKQDYELERDKVMKDPIAYVVPIELPGNEQEHLYNLKKSLTQDVLAAQGIGAKIKTDWSIYYQLRKEYVDSPQSFGDKDLMPFFPKLAESEKKELIKLQQESRQGKYDTELQNLSQYVNNLIKSIGLKETENKKDLKKANYIRQLFDNNLKTFPKDKQNSLETWNTIGDRLLLETDIAGSFIDTPVWEAMYGEKEIIKPKQKPKQIPKSAEWKQFEKNGVTYKGWVHFNPKTAVTLFYTLDGKTFSVKNKKEPEIRSI